MPRLAAGVGPGAAGRGGRDAPSRAHARPRTRGRGGRDGGTSRGVGGPPVRVPGRVVDCAALALRDVSGGAVPAPPTPRGPPPARPSPPPADRGFPLVARGGNPPCRRAGARRTVGSPGGDTAPRSAAGWERGRTAGGDPLAGAGCRAPRGWRRPMVPCQAGGSVAYKGASSGAIIGVRSTAVRPCLPSRRRTAALKPNVR
jgi:hypothetical protein